MKLTTVFCMIAVLMVAFAGSAHALPLPDLDSLDFSHPRPFSGQGDNSSNQSSLQVIPFPSGTGDADNQNLIDYVRNHRLGSNIGHPSTDSVDLFAGIESPVNRRLNDLNLDVNQLRDLFPIRDNDNTFQVPPRVNPEDLIVVLSVEQLQSKYFSLNADKVRYDRALDAVENDLAAGSIDASEAVAIIDLIDMFEVMVNKAAKLQTKAESLARSAHFIGEGSIEEDFTELALEFEDIEERARQVNTALQNLLDTFVIEKVLQEALEDLTEEADELDDNIGNVEQDIQDGMTVQQAQVTLEDNLLQFHAELAKLVGKAEEGVDAARRAHFRDYEEKFKEVHIELNHEFTVRLNQLETALNTIVQNNVDTDGDGIVDTSDNCPNTANPAQTDTDGDGLGDACDAVNNNDTDGDGVVNSSDNCPAVANGNQADADLDNIGDVCDAVNNTSTYQGRFDTLKNSFDDFENDFDDYKKKYKKAVRDDDSSDVRRFKQKLNDLKGDLDQLTEDAEEIQDDIKDDSHRRDFESLSDDVDEFINDIENLQDEIKEVLGETSSRTEEQRQQLTDSTPTAARRTPAVTPEPVVVVQPLDFSGVRAPVVEQPAPVSAWEQVRGMVYLGAGIAVLIAVIIFMLALIVSRKN